MLSARTRMACATLLTGIPLVKKSMNFSPNLGESRASMPGRQIDKVLNLKLSYLQNTERERSNKG